MSEATASQQQLARLIQSSQLVDLSQLLAEALPSTWPGHMVFQHKLWNWFAPLELISGHVRSTNPYQTRYCIIDEHTGTHFDAPTHFVPPPDSGLPLASEAGLESGDRVPLADLQGPAVVIDVRHLESHENGKSPWITRLLVRDWEQANGPLQAGEVVLFYTGWDRYYVTGDEGKKYVWRPVEKQDFPGWPAPSVELIEYLLARGVRCLGIDAPSIGAAHNGIPPHQAGLSRRMRYIESLTHLGQLPTRGAYFIFMPIKLANSSGGPGRALAFV